MNITCTVIDDEPLALNLLKSYVERTPFLELKGTYSSAVEAINGLHEQPVELVFVDIQMPELDGINFAHMLNSNVRVVFTTAFSQYALEGYKTNALDYLLKPISYSDFLRAANKAREWFELINNEGNGGIEKETEDSIFVKSDYKLLRIRYNDILYIESLKDYVKIYLESTTRPILSLTSMKALEERLPTDKFMRTHRSYIVNLSKVDVFERGQIVFGQKIIPVSDSYKEKVMAYVDHRLPKN